MGMAGGIAVHLVRCLFGELGGCWAAGIVLTRVKLKFGGMTVAWVYSVVSLLAVDRDCWMVGWMIDGRASRKVVF